MRLYIKFMLCQRCMDKVREALKACGISGALITMGEVELEDSVSQEQVKQLKNEVLKLGMEVIDDKKMAIIEQIKLLINDHIDNSEEELKVNLSDHLSEKLNYNYVYIANLFSEYEGMTIAHFVVRRKIEKAKELMLYNDLTLTEIAFKLHYSSVAHLSSQFKKVTGMTPSVFKSLIERRKTNLSD